MSASSSSATRKPIVVIGAAGHASVVLDAVEKQDVYQAVRLLDNAKPIGTNCGGMQVSGTRDDLAALRDVYPDLEVIVAIGENWVRACIADEIQGLCPGIKFATVIHPSAELGRGVLIGQGTVIMAGVVVNASAQVGECSILNTRASLDHDSVMGRFASLGPAAAVGGGVRIGPFSHVGIGASVIQGMEIGTHCVVGAGAVVVRHIPDSVVAYGSPARVIRSRQPEDRYMSEASGTKAATK